jgi:hypothetical protein
LHTFIPEANFEFSEHYDQFLIPKIDSPESRSRKNAPQLSKSSLAEVKKEFVADIQELSESNTSLSPNNI